ncbi:MAG: M36 family metallopeptidase [Bryobacterales bacterium]
MNLSARSAWVARAVAALTVGLGGVAGWAQTAPKERPSLHFDIRRHPAFARQAGAGLAAESKVTSQRRIAASTAAGQPGGSPTRLLRFNEFGLPKAVLHPGGAAPQAAQGDPLALARNYLRGHSTLFPFSQDDLANLRTAATSRSAGLTFLTLTQTVDGIPVFGGHVRMVFDSGGAVLQAGVDDVIPRLSVDTRPQLTADDAVRRALRLLNVEAPSGPLAEVLTPGAGRTAFAHPGGAVLDPIIAELSIFPVTAVSARLAYRIFATSERGSYEILVDAADGQLLYAADLSSRAGQARVWRESPIEAPRELVALPDTWLASGATVTTGNNTDAYLDWDGDDQPDAFDFANLNGGRAFSASSVFDFPAGEGSTGQDPTEFSASAVTNAFYFVNLAHDFFYDLGFTEEAGNFQADNFGRGGLGNDAVRTHVQDGTVFGGARFRGAPEGLAPVLELGIAPQGTLFEFSDDRDFALDGEVVIHEYAHGVTDRIVGGPNSANCLFGMQSGALSEGWSDYFALSYFDDPVAGEYTANNAERGIRRYAYDRNPLTYEDLGNEGFRVHNDGEIWAATLWEIRQALGSATTDQLVINALRLTPCNPHMIDARDAILDADQAAHNGSHHPTLWTIFARHGMGHSASGFDGGFLDSNAFNAAFDLPPGDAPQNSNPTILGRPRELANVGQQYVYSVPASDADGDALSYELLEGPPGMEVSATGQMTFTATSLVPPRAKVVVTDGKGGRVIHGFSVPVLPILPAGRAITIDGPAFQSGYAGFTVGPGTPLVQITLRGGSGDPDLVVYGPDMTVADSFRVGTEETISIVDPAPGMWLVEVGSAAEFRGVRLAVQFPTASQLAANSRAANLQGPLSSETFYRFTVPEGAMAFTISTGNGSGDVDLYLARGRYPVCQNNFLVSGECDYDEASELEGNFETITVKDASLVALEMKSNGGGPITVAVVEPGDWFINLSAYEAYQGVTLTVTINMEGSVAPTISNGGVVHAASYLPKLAPGGIATLFGANLALETAQASSVPLPRELGGVRVLVNGVAAPLFYVSPGQINFQTPFETAPGVAGVTVERDGVPSALVGTAVQADSPGIFTYQRTPEIADPVVVHADGAVVSPQNPARPGEVVVIYATGVGSLTNRPATGEGAPAEPFAISAVETDVMVGNLSANVLFAGLTPGYVGLLQINVQLPDVLPPGDMHGLVALFGTSASQRVALVVE